MVETILKCTFLFVENEGNCAWVFPCSNQTLCINNLCRVFAKPVSERTTSIHTQAPKGASEVH